MSMILFALRLIKKLRYYTHGILEKHLPVDMIVIETHLWLPNLIVTKQQHHSSSACSERLIRIYLCPIFLHHQSHVALTTKVWTSCIIWKI